MKLSKRRGVVFVMFRILVVCVAGLMFGSCASRFVLGDWPETSEMPVTVLEHPTVESKVSQLKPGVDEGYQFVSFGDQRALADGEWQAMIKMIGTLCEQNDRLLFMMDSGDIVSNGDHSDQFVMLREILSVVPDLPYLVGVGNHEKNSNRSDRALANTAAFLAYTDEAFSEDRMYYRKDIGPIRFLMLDSSDFVYGDEGRAKEVGVVAGSRGAAQLRWLTAELSRDDISTMTTIVALHHPFVQTSTRHRSTAQALWEMEWEGRTLPNILVDGGVDIIMVGHTHTYERFHLRRDDGSDAMLVNISGRPRPSGFLWKRSPRRSIDIRGKEMGWFDDKGWAGLDRWAITQEDGMYENESNQFALFSVTPDGGVMMEVFYLDDTSPSGFRRDDPVRLK